MRWSDGCSSRWPSVVLPALNLPPWTITFTTVLLLLGFPDRAGARLEFRHRPRPRCDTFGRDRSADQRPAPLHRRPALREHERRRGTEAFRRRHRGGPDDAAAGTARRQSHVPAIRLRLPGPPGRCPDDLARARLPVRRRRQRTQDRRSDARDRAAHRRAEGRACLGRALRPPARGCVRAPGRDLRPDRRRDPRAPCTGASVDERRQTHPPRRTTRRPEKFPLDQAKS